MAVISTSRANAFSMMGFDTFQSKEMLDITDYTPLGSWPTDDILVGATIDAMASTDTPDFIYTITWKPTEIIRRRIFWEIRRPSM